jgi:preprotein translocase SecE subunit
MSEKKEQNNNGKVAAKNKNNEKKPNFFVRMFRGIKKGCVNMWSELKRVTWAKFPTVVKQTSVVLGVVLVFLIVITAFDFGLGRILSVIRNAVS